MIWMFLLCPIALIMYTAGDIAVANSLIPTLAFRYVWTRRPLDNSKWLGYILHPRTCRGEVEHYESKQHMLISASLFATSIHVPHLHTPAKSTRPCGNGLMELLVCCRHAVYHVCWEISMPKWAESGLNACGRCIPTAMLDHTMRNSRIQAEIDSEIFYTNTIWLPLTPSTMLGQHTTGSLQGIHLELTIFVFPKLCYPKYPNVVYGMVVVTRYSWSLGLEKGITDLFNVYLNTAFVSLWPRQIHFLPGTWIAHARSVLWSAEIQLRARGWAELQTATGQRCLETSFVVAAAWWMLESPPRHCARGRGCPLLSLSTPLAPEATRHSCAPLPWNCTTTSCLSLFCASPPCRRTVSKVSSMLLALFCNSWALSHNAVTATSSAYVVMAALMVSPLTGSCRLSASLSGKDAAQSSMSGW